MTGRDDCFAELLNSFKDRRDRKFINDNMEKLEERVRTDESGDSPREKYARAAKEMMEEETETSAKRQRTIRLHALALRDMRTFIDSVRKTPGGSVQLGLEAALAGTNRPLFDPKSRYGNQLSAAAVGLGAADKWLGDFEMDLIRAGRDNPKFAGLDKIFYSGEHDRDIFREKAMLEAQAKGRASKVGYTKNEQALEIARLMVKADKVKNTALNGKGAWITEHSSFAAPISHDPEKMLSVAGNRLPRMLNSIRKDKLAEHQLWQEARELWTAKTLPRINARAMFGTTVDADKKLAEMFGGLVTQDYAKLSAVEEQPSFPNAAAQVSVSRAFVWKSIDDQLDHMKDFGRFTTPTTAWLHSLRSDARTYGLMTRLGPLPKQAFEESITYARNLTMGTPERRALEKQAPEKSPDKGYLRNLYGVVSGETDRPIASVWNGIVRGVMGVQRWAKLGLTPFAMIQDNATIAAELGYQFENLNFFQRQNGGGLLSGYLKGPDGSAKRLVAELLHNGLRFNERDVGSRWDAADGAPGLIAKIDGIFFRKTGILPMTENKRSQAEGMMADMFGRERNKAFAELDASEARIMQAMGIGDKEWDLLKKAEWNEIEGKTYFTPDIADRLSDADVKAYLDARGSISERAVAGVGEEATGVSNLPTPIERAREDLGMKLWAYFAERGRYAVVEAGARENAILYQGSQVGSPLNTALKLFMQFKQFPTAMVTKIWGRELYGGRGGLGRVAAVVEFAVVSTLYGIAANYMNSLAKGQDPNSSWRNQPLNAVLSGFTRGGVGSIYGDFLLGEWSRFGVSASATAIGPTFGQFDTAMELYSAMTHPTKWKGQSLALASRFVRSNLPFANMIMTKSAIDYLIFYRMQEYLNPGYLERMERTMKDKQGIEFLLSPQKATLLGATPH